MPINCHPYKKGHKNLKKYVKEKLHKSIPRKQKYGDKKVGF